MLSDCWYALQQELFSRLKIELGPMRGRYESSMPNWRVPLDSGCRERDLNDRTRSSTGTLKGASDCARPQPMIELTL